MRSIYWFRRAKKPFSILVLRNNDLGDLVVTTPLFRALRLAFPDAYIVAAVGSWSKDILVCNPYISEVVDCNGPWHNHSTGPKSLLKTLEYIFCSREAARLRTYRFDIGIDVLGSTFGSMLLIHLRIPVRLGRRGYAGGYTGSTAYLDHTTEESVAKNAIGFVKLLKSDAVIDIDPSPQLFLDAPELEAGEKAWQEIEETGNNRRPRFVVAPGAGLPTKCWPVEGFEQVVQHVSKEACGCVLGSQADHSLGEMITKGIDGWSNRCGMVSLRQSMALIAKADFVICNASLVMHFAAAFKKPCIVILTKEQDPNVHANLWEVKGVHYSLYPFAGEQQVRVSAVNNQVELLLSSLRDEVSVIPQTDLAGSASGDANKCY
jgi:heptosyltransferase-2